MLWWNRRFRRPVRDQASPGVHLADLALPSSIQQSMDDTMTPSAWRGSTFYPHEWAFFCLGSCTFLVTWWRSGSLSGIPLEAGLATALYGCVVAGLRKANDAWQKIRLLASYGFLVWFYFSVARLAPAVGAPVQDEALYALDRALFRETPAVYLQSLIMPWLTDLLSACYLSFHVYLQLAVLHLLWRRLDAAVRLSIYLFTSYAIGFCGYLLVPAMGPWKAFPQLFSIPLAGGVMTQLNAWVVAQGSSVYDVFPSLHVLVTFVLLDHDWREVRSRFWVMLVPTLGLVVATIYLRYHYAVDLLAGGALFLILRRALARWIACPERASRIA
jgi:hypothetical protein